MPFLNGFFMPRKPSIIERTFNGKPNLVVFFKTGALLSSPFDDPRYFESYMDFFKIAQRYFSAFVVRGRSSYQGDGIFSQGYCYQNGKFTRHLGSIASKVVFDKGELHVNSKKGWDIISEGTLACFLCRKDLIYRKFQRFMKPTFRVRNKAQCQAALKKIRGTMAVFKPVDRYGGEGVIIALKHKFVRELKNFDGIITEFVDTSHGIQGITKSYHDLRMTVMDGKIVETKIRIPQAGSFLANVARGGTEIEFHPKRLPQRARMVAEAVDRYCGQFGHRIFSVDVGFEGTTPYLFELNDEPGFPGKKYGLSHYRRWHLGLLRVLRAAARDAERV
jgi:hypothetical protein